MGLCLASARSSPAGGAAGPSRHHAPTLHTGAGRGSLRLGCPVRLPEGPTARAGVLGAAEGAGVTMSFRLGVGGGCQAHAGRQACPWELPPRIAPAQHACLPHWSGHPAGWQSPAPRRVLYPPGPGPGHHPAEHPGKAWSHQAGTHPGQGHPATPAGPRPGHHPGICLEAGVFPGGTHPPGGGLCGLSPVPPARPGLGARPGL